MELHHGRLLDHVHLRVRDLESSRRFYESALGSLGLQLQGGEDFFWSDELFVSADGPQTEHLHLAFSAQDEEAFDASTPPRSRVAGPTTALRANVSTTRVTRPPTSSIRMVKSRRRSIAARARRK